MGRFGQKSAIALAILATVAAVWAQEPVFRVSTKLVRMIVTVKNPKGELVGDLNKDEFKITDLGVPQSIAVFEHHTEVPLSVTILVDTSGSTAKDINYEIESVRKFIRAILKEGNPEYAVTVIDQPSSRFEQDLPGPVVFREVPIVGPLSDLQMPEAQAEEGHHEEESHPENHEPAMEVTKFGFCVIRRRHGSVYVLYSETKRSMLNRFHASQ